MPGEISRSYEGPADPCPACGGEGRPGCPVCRGSGWLPDDYECPDGGHQWTGRQLGGPPDMAESSEWVAWCKLCGVEKQD